MLTGKGVTFDSGGISIKPANRMDEMKDDMAGAAAVISTMEAIAHLKPRVNVIGITPIAENMPSGTAVKPGDIVTFYNGMTAEVKNTDAEGRLILADALSYAVKHYKPDMIINVATLTGSCAAALGPFFAGMMSNHDIIVEKLTRASQRSAIAYGVFRFMTIINVPFVHILLIFVILVTIRIKLVQLLQAFSYNIL